MNDIDINFDERLEKQLRFIVEIDKIKNIARQSKLFDGGRFENDAEHSWTIAVMALLLKEHADFPVSLERVVPMLLIHDIVEVDAGDTFLYSEKRNEAHDREAKAADRIFGLLDGDQKSYFCELWEEFEAQETNNAKFAFIFDRLEPLLQNYATGGYTWKKHGVTYDMVIEKSLPIKESSEKIWRFILAILDKSVEQGYLSK